MEYSQRTTWLTSSLSMTPPAVSALAAESSVVMKSASLNNSNDYNDADSDITAITITITKTTATAITITMKMAI